MKLHSSKAAFLLILLEVYGAFSEVIDPQPEPTLVLQDSLIHVSSCGDCGKSPRTSFSVNSDPLHLKCCHHPWALVGKTCLFTDLSKNTSWQEGRNFCKELHERADLAIFRDANEFAEILRHVRTINSFNQKLSFWVGGSDLDQSEDWRWVTGEPMPMGSPFWGEVGSGRIQPEANDEHCVYLDFHNRYYMHDVNCKGCCNFQVSPLCQYNPFPY